MQVRGCVGERKRELYAKILDADAIGGKGALAGSRGRGAMTTLEHFERERRTPCKVFRGAGEICERPTCGHVRAKHPRVWVQGVAA